MSGLFIRSILVDGMRVGFWGCHFIIPFFITKSINLNIHYSRNCENQLKLFIQIFFFSKVLSDATQFQNLIMHKERLVAVQLSKLTCWRLKTKTEASLNGK